MKIIKILFKIFIISAIITAIVTAGIALYMKLYGKSVLQDTLSKLIGSDIKYESLSLNLKEYKVNFKGFTILDKINFDKDILNAERVALVLNKEKFNKEKKIAIEEIIIKKGVLNIERNRKGIFNLSYNTPKKTIGIGAVAYADTPQKSEKLYNFAKTIKKVTIENSIINFKDYFISREPFAIICNNVNLDVKCGQKPDPQTGSISTVIALDFKIQNRDYENSEVFFNANMAVYKNKVDMDTALQTEYIDLVRFLPYFEKYTPFSFTYGLFSSYTNFEIHNNIIRSLTTMTFHRLRLRVDRGKENTQFLEASVDRLVPYLTSGSGKIIFDFVMEGPVDNPHLGIGPRVKNAIGMVAIEELGKILQQMQ